MEKKMIKKCLFPVAGYGTRFLPATKAMAKEMMPIVNKPLIHYGVEEAAEAGIHSFGFVTSRGKRAVADYFDAFYELEHQVKGSEKEKLLISIKDLIENNDFAFTRQHQMRGLGHAILSGRVLIGDNSFAVILADDLCIVDEGDVGVLSQMVKIHDTYGCNIVAIQEVPKDKTHKYGIVAGEQIEDNLFRVSDMIEKPNPGEAPSNMAVIGRYILTPDMFDIISQTTPGRGGEVQVTDALKKQAQKGCVLAYKFRGRRFDCGSIDGFVEATNYVYEHMYKNNDESSQA
jgi:UTP--glucose-1-phosphate uridylyltransferase